MAKTIKMDEILSRKERNTVLYIGYDNEAFMNTGIQESGTTPIHASTTTGPGGVKIKGKIGIKEQYVPGFTFLGHKNAFFATANIAYPLDFMGKIMDAMKSEGAGFIQVFTPCPRGWRHPSERSVEIAKLATESGYWPLYTVKVKDGVPVYYYNKVPKMEKPDEENGEYFKINEEKFIEFVKSQGKFRHLIKPQFLEEKIDDIIAQSKAYLTNLNRLISATNSGDKLLRYIINPAQLPAQHLINPGHGLCPGCGAGTMLNQLTTAASKVAGKNVIFVNNTCCVEVATSKDDVTSWQAPWMHQLFESGATVADAISTAYRIMKNKGIKKEVPFVIHIGGDGSTINIGYQFLKSAIVRASGYQIMNPDLDPY